MQSDAIFKNMPVGRAILTLAVPSVFSVLVMILYNMADLFFVARLGDNAQVAAVSLVGPVFSLLAAVATMAALAAVRCWPGTLAPTNAKKRRPFPACAGGSVSGLVWLLR